MSPRRLCVFLLLAARSLGAQDPQTRLAGRVPAVALPALDSIIKRATDDGLPPEPLIQKALEGGAKRAEPGRIVHAVGAAANQLRSAQALLRRTGEPPPSDPAEITAVAAALSRGVSPPLAKRLAAALPGEPPGPALHAVGDLVGHGFAESSSVDLIVQAARHGLRGLRFLDVASAAVQELQRGQSHDIALARVRDFLPDIPPPPRPAPAAVSKARRVQRLPPSGRI